MGSRSKAGKFDEWMDKEAKSPNGSAGAIWDKWPQEVLDELKMAIERNDNNPDKRVPLNALIDRWLGLYDTRVSRDTVRRYCRLVLGRKNYTQEK